MAKKHFGKLLTLAAIVGAAAAGVSYVLQYKSFHKELDEDFHDFEDDFDDFDDAGDKEASKASDTAASERSYVSLNPEKKEAPAETPEETSEHSEESEKAPADADVSSEEPVKTETVRADAPVSEDGESSSEKEDSDAAPDDSTTVTVEEITEEHRRILCMIQSLLRAMELLELLKEANHKYSIAELSESTGLPPSTIHRILQTFCEKKYVIRDEHAHTYQLGPALISLGRAAADNVRIQDAALPILKNLSYCTREDSYLIIQVGDKGLVLDKTDGPNHLKVVEEFGYEMDLHCGAIRKALLAFQSNEYIRRYLDTRLNRPEAFPKADPAELAEELRTIREKGIAVSHGEYVPDAVGIGAPIYGIDGRISASVGIIAPYSRIEDDTHLLHLQDQVRHSAAELSYYMGHTFKQEK